MRRFTNPNPDRAIHIPTLPTLEATEGAGAFRPLKQICLEKGLQPRSRTRYGVPHISILRCGIACTALMLASVSAQLIAQPQTQTQTKPTQPLTQDHDPVRSPDAETTKAPTGEVAKQGGGYIVRAEVEEVSLNVTVLDNKGQIVQDLKKDDFKVLEDGVQQNLLSFQHADIPVSIGLVIDNSGSMYKKRPSVNKSSLDLILASNPKDEAFVVNFADDAYIDQDLTSDPNKLKDGLGHIESRGGTALYDAVVASADKLAADAHRPKQVIVIITDGEDNASTLNLEQAIRRVQQLSGPVIYSIGLLFGDEVARDIRSQYTLAYHSTKPTSDPGFRKITVTAQAKGEGKLNVRTRTGYFPSIKNAKPVLAPAPTSQ